MKCFIRLCSLFLLILYFKPSYSQWTNLNFGNGSSSLNCSFFKGLSEGYAAGAQRIYRTTNSGLTWDTVNYGANYNLLVESEVTNIHFVSALEGIASGNRNNNTQAIIFKTYDGGFTWDSVVYIPSGSRQIRDMYFLSASTGYCVGTNGLFLQTADSGNSWSSSLISLNDLNSVFFNGTNGWIAGENTILKTTNGGASFTSHFFNDEVFHSIFFTSDSVGYAGGTYLYKTTDAGTTWNLINTSDSVGAVKIWATSADTLFVSTYNSVLKSNNAGMTWHPQYSLPYGKTYTSLFFIAGIFGIATTETGEIYKTFTNGDAVQNNDAGISFIPDPGLCTGNSHPLKIKLKNFGQQVIQQAKIDWQMDGVAQPDYLYNGNLSYDSSELVILGNYQFVNPATQVNINIVEVNNQNSININNDTASYNYVLGLSGTYTVGGSSPDFPNLKAAISQLKQSGSCGNVTFSLRSGNYSIEDSIISYAKSNLNDSLAIISENGDSSAVRIFGTLIFKNQMNVLIRSVKVNAIQLLDSVNNFTISNCILDGDNNDITISHTGKALSNLHILNTKLINTTSAIYLTNDTLELGTNVNVVNCQIELINSYGIYFRNINNILVENNTVIGGDFSISVNNCNDGLSVTRNRLFGTGDYKIGLFNCRLDSINEGVVANNIAEGSSSFNFSSLTIQDCSYIKFYYNTISGHTPLMFNYTDTTFQPLLTMMNNIFDARWENPCIKMWFPTSSSQIRSDIFKNIGHNVYYMHETGLHGKPLFFSYYLLFSTWKKIFPSDSTSTLLLDEHFSFVGNQFVLNRSNLKVNNLGVAVIGINTDINGNLRDTVTPDPGCSEISLLGIDAGVASHSVKDYICSGLSNIVIEVVNYGVDPVFNVEVHWSVNGTLQPVYIYSGILLPGSSTGNLLIGQYNFSSATTFSIEVWSEKPNNMIDINGWNDTLKFTTSTLMNGMSGAYTIGGLMPDFTSLNSAVVALIANGICGPVEFNIRSGMYAETISIPYINGVSSSDTIVFKSEANDSSSVIILDNNNGPPVISLVAARYISFYKLSLHHSTFGQSCIALDNICGHINFKNCVITTLNGYGINYGLYQSYDVEISNNLIEGGGGVRMTASFGSWIFNTTIRNNIINNSRFSSIEIDNAVNVIVEGNLITSMYPYYSTLYSSGFNVSAYGNTKVFNNIILCNLSTVGMGLQGCLNYIDTFFVYNNMISASNSPNTIGVKLTKAHNFLFANNSILIGTTVSAGCGFEVSYSGNNYLVLNNSVSTNGGGVVPIKNILNSSATFYNNNYYAGIDSVVIENDVLGSHTLQSWQTATGKDSGSINYNPLYISNTDLHIRSPFLNNSGYSNAMIEYDIDGEPRNLVAPDIGCDEVYFNDSLVWPGDANYDGIADNYDLLPIGMYFGQAGIPRVSASNSWIGQPASNWGSLQLAGWDKKHVDCDGDGSIEWSDTVAIIQNWGSQHALGNRSSIISVAGLPSLYFKASTHTYYTGDTVTIELWSGDNIVSVVDLYGIAFDISCPMNLVKSGSMKLNFNSCWFGQKNVNLAAISKIDGLISATAIRVDGMNMSGYGKIADITFIVDPSLTSNSLFSLAISKYTAIKANGDMLQFNLESDSLQIISTVSVKENTWESDLKVYPVPTKDAIYLEYALSKSSEVSIRIFNSIGTEVYSTGLILKSQGLHNEYLPFVKSLPNEMYLIRVETSGNLMERKFVKL